MSDNEALKEKDEKPVFTLIQQIKDGILDPETLTKDLRQQCVEVLLGEGYAVASMAQILRRCDRTIKRDVEQIRERNALTPDINFAKKIVGDVFQKAMTHHGQLMRLARSTEANIGEKSQSEFLAWRVLKEVVEKMQTLGYLPMKAQAMVSDIYHHHDGDDTKTYQDLKKDLCDIERIAGETGTLDPTTEEGIKLLRQRIEKAEIAEGMSDLVKENKPNNNKEADNE